jgi:hypothetical protein
VREVLEILENIITQAGDLIESRSPELVAQARAALRRYADEAPRQAGMRPVVQINCLSRNTAPKNTRLKTPCCRLPTLSAEPPDKRMAICTAARLQRCVRALFGNKLTHRAGTRWPRLCCGPKGFRPNAKQPDARRDLPFSSRSIPRAIPRPGN